MRIIRSASILPIIVGLSGCGELCKTTIYETATSSDGRSVATVFERDCGATTPFSRLVAMRRTDDVVDLTNAEGLVLRLIGEPVIKLDWRAPTALSIEVVGDFKLLDEKMRWKDIQISRR